jgi:hypothetical protein
MQLTYMSNAHTHSKSRNSQIWIIQHVSVKRFSMFFACVVGQLLCLTTHHASATPPARVNQHLNWYLHLLERDLLKAICK